VVDVEAVIGRHWNEIERAKAVPWDSFHICKFIKAGVDMGNTIVFQTRHRGQRHPGMVLGILWPGNGTSLGAWFKNVPQKDIDRLEMSTGDYTWLLEEYCRERTGELVTWYMSPEAILHLWKGDVLSTMDVSDSEWPKVEGKFAPSIFTEPDTVAAVLRRIGLDYGTVAAGDMGLELVSDRTFRELGFTNGTIPGLTLIDQPVMRQQLIEDYITAVAIRAHATSARLLREMTANEKELVHIHPGPFIYEDAPMFYEYLMRRLGDPDANFEKWKETLVKLRNQYGDLDAANQAFLQWRAEGVK